MKCPNCKRENTITLVERGWQTYLVLELRKDNVLFVSTNVKSSDVDEVEVSCDACGFIIEYESYEWL